MKIAIIMLAVLCSSPAIANNDILGGGFSTCSVFNDALAKGDYGRTLAIIQWQLGFLSGINIFHPETNFFKVITIEIVTKNTIEYCAIAPDDKIYKAALLLLEALHK